jgi:hypothetical protein
MVIEAVEADAALVCARHRRDQAAEVSLVLF